MADLQFVMEPRDATIGQLVQDCADGKLPFSGPGSLCEKVAAMGYNTTSLYEIVRLVIHKINERHGIPETPKDEEG